MNLTLSQGFELMAIMSVGAGFITSSMALIAEHFKQRKTARICMWLSLAMLFFYGASLIGLGLVK